MFRKFLSRPFKSALGRLEDPLLLCYTWQARDYGLGSAFYTDFDLKSNILDSPSI